jgi:hypothetical protein
MRACAARGAGADATVAGAVLADETCTGGVFAVALAAADCSPALVTTGAAAGRATATKPKA